MSEEPTYLRQTGDPGDYRAAQDWLQRSCAEAHDLGCTFFRASEDPLIGLLLLEGWKTQPADQGPIRWQLVAQA